MTIETDDGFFFGMGVFETIAVENGELIRLNEHIERMRRGALALAIDNPDFQEEMIKERALGELRKSGRKRGVMKVTLTQKNLIFTQRENPYTEEDHRRGFSVKVSRILRNETSPFTYIKSTSYGVNLLEKRRAHREGFDEPVFLNTRGELTEGATTNLFLEKDGKIFTPPVSCGLLDGIERRAVMEKFSVEERILYPEDACAADAMFLTNSLLGVMKVRQFEEKVY